MNFIFPFVYYFFVAKLPLTDKKELISNLKNKIETKYNKAVKSEAKTTNNSLLQVANSILENKNLPQLKLNPQEEILFNKIPPYNVSFIIQISNDKTNTYVKCFMAQIQPQIRESKRFKEIQSYIANEILTDVQDIKYISHNIPSGPKMFNSFWKSLLSMLGIIAAPFIAYGIYLSFNTLGEPDYSVKTLIIFILITLIPLYFKARNELKKTEFQINQILSTYLITQLIIITFVFRANILVFGNIPNKLGLEINTALNSALIFGFSTFLYLLTDFVSSKVIKKYIKFMESRGYINPKDQGLIFARRYYLKPIVSAVVTFALISMVGGALLFLGK